MTEAMSCLSRLRQPLTPPWEVPAHDGLSPRQRARRLVEWLMSIQAALAAMSEDRAAQDESFWEAFLSTLGSCRDALAYEYFVRASVYGEFRHFFMTRFAEYAHYRDLKRGRAMVSGYTCRGGIDALSVALRDFLVREAAALRRTSGRSQQASRPQQLRMAIVGCGACPESLLFYAQEHIGTAHITALDVNRAAIEIARETMARFRVANVEFCHADGAEFNYRNYDVVHVANYVAPKLAVVQAIARTAPPYVTTVVRTPTLLETLICEEIDLARLEQFEESFRLSSQYCQMDSVYLKRRKGLL